MHIAYVALAAAGLVAAHPHQHGHGHVHLHHQHHHLEARAPVPDPEMEMVTVAGPTVVLYSLNGQLISAAEVEEGIKNGTLVWASGAPPPDPSSIVQEQESVPTTAPAPTTSAAAPPAAPTSSSSSSSSSSSQPAPVTPAQPAAETNTLNQDSSSSSTASWFTGVGVDSDFPDGQLDCSDFPSAYGALDISWMGIGGWIGIQTPATTNAGGYNDIVTGGSCSPGAFCSYACPYGYQKTQWPAMQGLTGQSIGGLQCGSDGKLHLTNAALSTKLCEQGSTAVNVQVVNNLGSAVSVCRTDYPGTESETVPLSVAAGGSEPLACPDSSAYYQWQGQRTSAQYYLNPAGVDVEDACQWGSASNPWGNWAPLNLGVGFTDGVAYVSMLPNLPTTSATLDYTVVLSSDESGQSCTYSGGVFTSAVLPGGSGTTGCTIAATGGTITYTFQ